MTDREAFEAWAKQAGWPHAWGYCNSGGRGYSPASWEVWQAARTQPAQQEVPSKRGWMCRTDFEHELGEAAGAVEIYASPDDLKGNRGCWDSCGMVEVEVRTIESALLAKIGGKT